MAGFSFEFQCSVHIGIWISFEFDLLFRRFIIIGLESLKYLLQNDG